MQQKVYVKVNPKQNQWTPATITQTTTTTQPSSYTVVTKDRSNYQRDRRLKWPAEEMPQPGKTIDSVIPSSNILDQPRREVKRPERLIETM